MQQKMAVGYLCEESIAVLDMRLQLALEVIEIMPVALFQALQLCCRLLQLTQLKLSRVRLRPEPHCPQLLPSFRLPYVCHLGFELLRPKPDMSSCHSSQSSMLDSKMPL